MSTSVGPCGSPAGGIATGSSRGSASSSSVTRDTRGLAGLANESVLEVTGRGVANPAARGGHELHDPVVTVVSAAIAPPFGLFRPTVAAQLPTRLTGLANIREVRLFPSDPHRLTP